MLREVASVEEASTGPVAVFFAFWTGSSFPFQQALRGCKHDAGRHLCIPMHCDADAAADEQALQGRHDLQHCLNWTVLEAVNQQI